MKLASFITLIFWYSHSIAQEFYYKTLSTEDGLPSNQIHTVYSDSRGYIWFGTPNGAVRWDSKSFKTYTIEDGLPNNEVLGFFEDSKRRLWISNFSTELAYLKNNSIFTSKKDKRMLKFSPTMSSRIFEFKNNIYYTTLHNSTQSFDIDNFKFTNKKDITSGNTYFYSYNNKLYGYQQKLNDTILMKGKIGDSIFSSFRIIPKLMYCSNNFFQYAMDSIIIPNYFQLSKIEYIKEESMLYEFRNILFFITDKMKLYFKGNKIVLFSDKNIKKLFYNGKNVVFLSEETFFNTKDQKINILPKEQGVMYNIDYGGQNKYILTKQSNIYELDNSFKNIRLLIENKPFDNIKHTRYDLKSNQYIIGTGSSLIQYRQSKYKILKEFKTYCSFLDSKNRLWYSGLDKIFYKDNFIDNLSNEKQFVLDSKNTVFVKDMAEDKYGNIFFTTNDGIYIYKSSTNMKYRLHNLNYLSSNECFKLVLDSSNNSIWVATTFGLNHVQYSDSKGKLTFKLVNRFFKSDGLQSNEINDVLIVGDSAWVATSKGLSLLVDKNYHPDSTRIPININSITINDSLFLKDTLGTLAYNQNNITIDYSAIYFPRRDRLAIYYRLIKNNDTITKELIDKSISLVSLENGQYKLQIYAFDRDYPYIKSGYKTLEFKINPPFYQTWWFYLLILLAILGIVYLIFRNRIKRAREIHEYETKLSQLKLEALKAEMNPHFIFNCLNAIKDYIMSNDTEKSQYYLDKLSKLIRQALYNSKDEFVNLRDEIQFIDNYVELERMRFDNHFDFIKEVDVDKHGHIQIPTMILQPFFENAIRHGKIGQIDRKGKLYFNIIEKRNTLVFTIKDNGIGMEEAEKIKNSMQIEHRSMAINIIKDRIEVYNKSYQLGISYTLSSIENDDYKTEVVLNINLNNL